MKRPLLYIAAAATLIFTGCRPPGLSSKLVKQRDIEAGISSYEAQIRKRDEIIAAYQANEGEYFEAIGLLMKQRDALEDRLNKHYFWLPSTVSLDDHEADVATYGTEFTPTSGKRMVPTTQVEDAIRSRGIHIGNGIQVKVYEIPDENLNCDKRRIELKVDNHGPDRVYAQTDCETTFFESIR